MGMFGCLLGNFLGPRNFEPDRLDTYNYITTISGLPVHILALEPEKFRA